MTFKSRSRRDARLAVAGTLAWLATCTGMVGCAPSYQRISPSVAVLAGYPDCAYETLGVVKAADGQSRTDIASQQLGAGTVSTWGETASESSVLAELRANAEKLGANAIVIRYRMRSDESSRSSSSTRAEQGLRMVATAIRTESSPMLEPCNATAWAG